MRVLIGHSTCGPHAGHMYTYRGIIYDVGHAGSINNLFGDMTLCFTLCEFVTGIYIALLSSRNYPIMAK